MKGQTLWRPGSGKETKIVEAKKPAAATPAATPAPKAPPPTEEEKAAQKAAEEARASDAEAQAKVGKINANLAKEGNSRRIMANQREGEPKYFWANFVPTQELTPEELEAVEGMK